MDMQYYNTAARKGQHLLIEERCIVAARIKGGENIYQLHQYHQARLQAQPLVLTVKFTYQSF